MKVVNLNKIEESIRIKRRHRIEEEDKKELEEDTSGMKKFHITYTVDGVKSEDTVSAENPQKAEELVKKRYDGKNIVFTSKEEVNESLEESKECKDEECEDKEECKECKESLEESVSKSDLYNALEYMYGFNKKEANDWIKKASDKMKQSVVDGWKGNAKKSFLTDSLKEEVEESLEEDLNTPSTPETEEATGLSNIIITAINDEWKTIAYYNDLVELLRKEGHDEMINVIEDIANEENKHVGQLQEIMKQLSPNTMSIADGETEGSEQLSEEDIDFYKPSLDVEIYDVDFTPDDDFGEYSGFENYF